MARRILSQNRGKGVPKCLAKNSKSKVGLNPYYPWMKEGYYIEEFINSGNHTGIFMKIRSKTDCKTKGILLSPRGVRTNELIGEKSIGSVICVGELDCYTEIMNIEFRPGSKARLARASGTSFKIVSKNEKEVKLISKKNKRVVTVHPKCLCTIGCVSGAGRVTIPFLKIGKKVNCKKKRAYSVSPNKMNAVDHPFGGNSPGCGRNKEIKRTASPGMKVGNIAPRRSGIKKK